MRATLADPRSVGRATLPTGRTCGLTDFQHARKGVPHLRVSGKGGKTRYLPLHPGTNALIHDYLGLPHDLSKTAR